MALKLILPDDEYHKLIKKMLYFNDKSWELLDRKDVPWEYLRESWLKFENQHKRCERLFFNSVSESSIKKKLKSLA